MVQGAPEAMTPAAQATTGAPTSTRSTLPALKHVLSAIPKVIWLPVFVAVGPLAVAATKQIADFPSRQLYIRAGLVAAALGLCFAFDDPAAPTTAASPTPLRVRRLPRLLLSLIPWSLAVAITIGAGSQGLDPVLLAVDPTAGPHLPLGRLLIEALTIAVTGLAIASIIASRWSDEPGTSASAVLLGLSVLLWAASMRWTPAWADPMDARWGVTIGYWGGTLIAASFVTALFSWDSRRPAIRAHRSRRS